jgi:hypothetical protein
LQGGGDDFLLAFLVAGFPTFAQPFEAPQFFSELESGVDDLLGNEVPDFVVDRRLRVHGVRIVRQGRETNLFPSGLRGDTCTAPGWTDQLLRAGRPTRSDGLNAILRSGEAAMSFSGLGR